MVPNFKWNTTTKLIMLIIIIFLSCWLLSTGYIETFIVGEDLSCPDRLYFDGRKYYLFRVNMPIIENINPIVFQTYQEYQQYNKTINEGKCGELDLTKPFRRQLSNKATEPILPYQWKCQREQAISNAKEIDCINGFYNNFTKEECDLFQKQPDRYYVNNGIERCMVKKTINDYPQLVAKGNKKMVEFTEEGLIRVGADQQGDPFRNIS
jgi:hypothetical protein